MRGRVGVGVEREQAEKLLGGGVAESERVQLAVGTELAPPGQKPGWVLERGCCGVGVVERRPFRLEGVEGFGGLEEGDGERGGGGNAGLSACALCAPVEMTTHGGWAGRRRCPAPVEMTRVGVCAGRWVCPAPVPKTGVGGCAGCRGFPARLEVFGSCALVAKMV